MEDKNKNVVQQDKQKPLSVMITELRNNLVTTINDSGIPIYLVEMILSELSQEVSQLSAKTVREEQLKYEEQFKK